MSRQKPGNALGDDAKAFRAWTIAGLEKLNATDDRQMAGQIAAWVRSLQPRSKNEQRKRYLTIGRRAEAKYRALLEQRAIEENDIAALRRLHPELAGFLNLLHKRGRPRKVPLQPANGATPFTPPSAPRL